MSRAKRDEHKSEKEASATGTESTGTSSKSTDGNDHPGYVVVFDGNTSLFRSRYQVQRWLKRTQRRLEEEQMSYAERHVRWMIENNCDDHGNPWPE